MMEELLYSALDLAAIISSMDLGCRAQAVFLEQIWENERAFLWSGYRDNKRQMILDTSYWLTYFSDKPTIDAEFPMIQRDAQATGGELLTENYTSDYADLDLFFKSARLRILYGGGKGYIRLKRRTLMKRYGYKKMSPLLMEHFHRCIYFYHLQPFVRDYVKCQIENVNIDEMIIFRVI